MSRARWSPLVCAVTAASALVAGCCTEGWTDFFEPDSGVAATRAEVAPADAADAEPDVPVDRPMDTLRDLPADLPVDAVSPTDTSMEANLPEFGLAIDPSLVSFPNTIIGQHSAPLGLRIRNVGSGGPAMPTFMLVGEFHPFLTDCGVLAPGATCSLSLIFAPTTAGAKKGSVTVIDKTTSVMATATLTGIAQFSLTVLVTSDPACKGLARGKVAITASDGPVTSCQIEANLGMVCGSNHVAGTVVQLDATSDAATNFVGFSDCPSPSMKGHCAFLMTGNITIRANFCNGG
jgi:hypothetical protein